MPDYAKYLSAFGEMVVVTSITTSKDKLEDQGNMCMFLGYAQNHNAGKYCMLNLRKNLSY